MILNKIAKKKRERIAGAMENLSLLQIKELALEKVHHKESNKLGSDELLFQKIKEVSQKEEEMFIFAEIKLASPSKGSFELALGVEELVMAYEEGGAHCISVVTEEDFFQGGNELFERVRQVSSLPLLRKDFILEPYQLYQSVLLGASAVLLIASLLEDKLKEMLDLAGELGLLSLVEVHTKDELELALKAGAKVIGINNRDLKTFVTSLDTTKELLPYIPGDRMVISESGIMSGDDIFKLQKMGEKGKKVDGILVGESLVKEKFPEEKIKELKKAKKAGEDV